MNGWLYGWKSIARFMGCSTKTARGYERRLNLPIFKIQGPKGSEVRVAIPSELNKWLGEQKKR